MSRTLDLDHYLQRGTVELGREEPPDERRARLRREGRRAFLDDIKDLVLFGVVLAGLGAMFAVCLWLAALAEGIDEATRKWAQTLAAAIVSGSVSYLLGRAQRKF